MRRILGIFLVLVVCVGMAFGQKPGPSNSQIVAMGSTKFISSYIKQNKDGSTFGVLAAQRAYLTAIQDVVQQGLGKFLMGMRGNFGDLQNALDAYRNAANAAMARGTSADPIVEGYAEIGEYELLNKLIVFVQKDSGPSNGVSSASLKSAIARVKSQIMKFPASTRGLLSVAYTEVVQTLAEFPGTDPQSWIINYCGKIITR